MRHGPCGLAERRYDAGNAEQIKPRPPPQEIRASPSAFSLTKTYMYEDFLLADVSKVKDENPKIYVGSTSL